MGQTFDTPSSSISSCKANAACLETPTNGFFQYSTGHGCHDVCAWQNNQLRIRFVKRVQEPVRPQHKLLLIRFFLQWRINWEPLKTGCWQNIVLCKKFCLFCGSTTLNISTKNNYPQVWTFNIRTKTTCKKHAKCDRCKLGITRIYKCSLRNRTVRMNDSSFVEIRPKHGQCFRHMPQLDNGLRGAVDGIMDIVETKTKDVDFFQVGGRKPRNSRSSVIMGFGAGRTNLAHSKSTIHFLINRFHYIVYKKTRCCIKVDLPTKNHQGVESCCYDNLRCLKQRLNVLYCI